MKFLSLRSLFGRLLLGFSAVMLLIWIGVLVWNIHDTRTEHKYSMEQETKVATEQALAVASALSDNPGRLAFAINRILEVRAKNYKENGLYESVLRVYVWKGDSLLYSNQRSAPLSPPSSEAAGYSHAIRMAGPWVSWVATDPVSGMTVQLQKEVVGRYLLTIASMAYYLLPLLFSFPFMLIPAFFVIRVSLRPLQHIVSQIEERSASDLSPLGPSPYNELSPLVSSVNSLMYRLSSQMTVEQQFLLDAAHELKTPMSVIQANAEGLLNDPTPEEARLASEGLRQGVARATHTIHQLLALARSGASGHREESQMLDLVSLARDRLALAANLALRRGVEIELQAPDACVLPLHRESIASLIDNLIDNAVKYSPDKSCIMVSIAVEPGRVRLTVTDQGPGIPANLRSKVFERFYRIPGQDQEGSGLGLAIAESAAARNHASIRFEAGPHNVGLSAIVEFRIDLQHEPHAAATERTAAV
jgi:two-component system sensor histidine kinase QseC